MAFEIIKTIKGREYRYLVKGVREGKKVRHKFVKYLGPVKPVNKSQRKKSSGRKPTAFIRQPTAEERQALEKASRANDAYAKERAIILLHSAEDLRVANICNKTGREKRSVLQAIKDFNVKGITSLNRGKTTGRKKIFTEEQKAQILQVVNTDPRKLGKNFTTWSLPKLQKHIQENKVVEKISIETLRQILITGNKKYKKSSKWLHSNDPDFAKKNSLLTD